MTYAEAEDFLFNGLRNYLLSGEIGERVTDLRDGLAFKQAIPDRLLPPSKASILQLLSRMGNPHAALEYVHVAGTNGKGSTSHAIASLFSAAGAKVGLYTSPHYAHFSERVKIDGRLIPEEEIIVFVETFKQSMLDLRISFFEATAALAFWYFERKKVDLVVLEVGLGGTWDATNVIAPLLAVITNIGFDHVAELGPTLPRIAAEKAGIMQAHTPTLIGLNQPQIAEVFTALAAGIKSRIFFSDEVCSVTPEGSQFRLHFSQAKVSSDAPGRFESSMSGPFAADNLQTAIAAYSLLRPSFGKLGLKDAVWSKGFDGLKKLSDYGYMGRNQVIQHNPLVLTDAGHNREAWEKTLPNLGSDKGGILRVVCGFKIGKMPLEFFDLLPKKNTVVYFCEANALAQPAEELLKAFGAGFAEAKKFKTVSAAYRSALADSTSNDFIFVGGSSYVVGDLLAHLKA